MYVLSAVTRHVDNISAMHVTERSQMHRRQTKHSMEESLLRVQAVPRRCLLVQGMEIPDPTGLIPANIENGLSVGTDALVMLGILIGMRVVAYLQMTLAIKFHKL